MIMAIESTVSSSSTSSTHRTSLKSSSTLSSQTRHSEHKTLSNNLLETRSSSSKHHALLLSNAVAQDAFPIPSSGCSGMNKKDSSKRGQRSSRVIQDALDIAQDTVERKLCRNMSNERAFFGEKAFPLPDIFDMEKARTSTTSKKTKAQAPDFFKSSTEDFFAGAPLPPAAPMLTPPKPSTPSRSSSRSRKKQQIPAEEENKPSGSSGRRRSRSRGRRSASKRHLCASEHTPSSTSTMNNRSTHSHGIPKTRTSSITRSEHRGKRSSSKNCQAARCSSARRQVRSSSKSRSRSKSRDRNSKTTTESTPLRGRRPKTPSTTKPSRSGSDTMPQSSNHQSDERAARRSKSAAIINAMFQSDIANDKGKEFEGVPPPPAEVIEGVATPSDRRSALARRRASRSSGMVGSPSPTASRKKSLGSPSDDVAPQIPVRSPDRRNSRSGSVARRRCLSKRLLLEEEQQKQSSDHTGTTTTSTTDSLETASTIDEDDDGGFPFGIGTTPTPAPQPRRQSSLPKPKRQNSLSGRSSRTTGRQNSAKNLNGSKHSRTTGRQNSARHLNGSKHKRTTGPLISGSGEVKAARPSLQTTSSGDRRQSNVRIDGLLQKLRDPSSRNLDMQSATRKDGDSPADDVSALRKPGMMGRFSKNLMRLDE